MLDLILDLLLPVQLTLFCYNLVFSSPLISISRLLSFRSVLGSFLSIFYLPLSVYLIEFTINIGVSLGSLYLWFFILLPSVSVSTLQACFVDTNDSSLQSQAGHNS